MIGRIKNEARTRYKEIAKNQFYKDVLNKVPLLMELKMAGGKIFWKSTQKHQPLHGDVILVKTIKKLVEDNKINYLVETGTYKGDTTQLLARMFPNLTIYTCEVNDESYQYSKKRLAKFSNVKTYKGSSEQILNKLIKEKLIDGRTLFYLDAHWENFWPLEDELKIITNKLESSIIIIDDFKVPGNDKFAYDRYEDKECSLEMVNPNISKSGKYKLLFPKYGEEIFDKNKLHPALVGYSIIFHNMGNEFVKFNKSEFGKKFFKDESKLIS